MAEDVRSLPLPADPVLASWASALNDAGYWAYVFDAAVPMLVAGAGFEFDDRGQHQLKGIDGTWQLLVLKG